MKYLYLFLSAFLWSTSFPVVKWGLSYIEPFQFVFFRFLLAFFFFLPFLKFNIKKILRRDLLITGLLSATGYLFQFTGQKYTLSGRASLFINTYILWIPIIIYFFEKRSLNKNEIISLIFSLIGLFLLFYKDIGKFEITYLKGDILTLFSSFSWAFYIILAKKILKETPPFEFTAIIIFLTLIFLFPFSLINFKFPKNLQGYYAIFHLAFFCTFLAYFLYHIGLSKTSEFTSSLFLLLEVLFAIILSFIFLKEKFTLIQIIGSLFILSSILFGAK